MMIRFARLAAFCAMFSLVAACAHAEPEFKDFGPMMEHAGKARVVYGPAADGELAMVYLLFNNSKGSWFMVAMDTRDGSSNQYAAPGRDKHVTSGVLDEQGRLYAGTTAGHLYRFDPKQPDKGLVNLGKQAEGAGYLFSLSRGPDGRLYMGSYPGGKLLVFDPETGKTQDYGQARPGQAYTQVVAPTKQYAYVDAGTQGHQIIRIDLETGEKFEIDTTEAFGDDQGPHKMFLGVDDKVYVYAPRVKKYGVIEDDHVVYFDQTKVRPAKEYGRYKSIPSLTLKLDYHNKEVNFTRASGETGRWPIEYSGAMSRMFVISESQGTIYGSSALPLRVFTFDLATRTLADRGIPFPNAGGEVYSFLPYDSTHFFAGAYGDADMIVFDPTQPWDTGGRDDESKAEGTNPKSLGVIGDEQNRPYVMLKGPDDMVYVATTADYGAIGGALTRLDPADNSKEIFRNIVQDHSITSLANVSGSDHLIAVGSSSMNSGHKPGAFGPPELLLWDTNKNEVAYRTQLPKVDSHYILQLHETTDGNILGICGNDYKKPRMFVFDPNQREFLTDIDVSEHFTYVQEGSNFSPLIDGRHFLVTQGKIYTVQVQSDGRAINIEQVATYPNAFKCAIVAPDKGDNDRETLFFLTGTNLIGLYLDSIEP